MTPLSIATRGYLDSLISIATIGRLTVKVIIIKDDVPVRRGFLGRQMYRAEDIERKVYLKRNPKLIREEDELILILNTFLICQS
jgi:hypothetical protein